MKSWILALIAIVYVGILFVVAWYSDYRGDKLRQRWRPVIYSLSLAVYCTAWTFFGAVGQASDQIWSFIPIYLGPTLVFVLCWKLLVKMIMVSKRENITSVADFIASRHGRSPTLAILITLILVVGILPYIALQLKAIVQGFAYLVTDKQSEGNLQDLAMMVTLVLAMFAIMFGTRRLDTTEHQTGVMTAIAFESVLKLLVFLGVSGWVCWQASLFKLPEQVYKPMLERFSGDWLDTLIIPTIMSMAAILCLPRQFYVVVVENSSLDDLKVARWMFPLYLLLAGLLVFPLTVVGEYFLGTTVAADLYVIALPAAFDNYSLAVLAYLGGVSAAISMVIVATIALSNMISNEILMPLILQRSRQQGRDFYRFSGLLLNVRRTTILLLLLMAYVVYRLLDGAGSLAGIGQMSFSAVAQLAPVLIGSLYLRESNKKAAVSALILGVSVWLYCLVIPVLVSSGWLKEELLIQGYASIPWLRPTDLFGLGLTNTISGATLVALSLNIACYLLGCLYFRPGWEEKQQAQKFVDVSVRDDKSYQNIHVTEGELEQLASRFMGKKRIEKVLLDDVQAMVDEASEMLQFNRALLQGAIEHIDMGISVIDRDLRLVAWNRQYLELFNYPEGLIRAGRSIAGLIRHNARLGLCGPGSVEEHVQKRLSFMRQGTAHKSERIRPDGRVIRMQGSPMPGGGFVMSFTDITEFRQVEAALKEVNENLEHRVQERTSELSILNHQLWQAKSQAEKASHARSKFFAAVSHDLMQPLNAARLFASSLELADLQGDEGVIAKNISHSLTSAENLLTDLLDMSRLEAGKFKTNIRGLSLTEILQPLDNEFQFMAARQGVEFKVIMSDRWVRSDPVLLRRILQNFLTNAFRYGINKQASRRILVCCRRAGKDSVRIEVRDNGPGIPEEKQHLIFAEFERLGTDGKGLGLGLAIAKGIANKLGHKINVRSQAGYGAVFSVAVVTATRQVRSVTKNSTAAQGRQLKKTILCIDNEPDILKGMGMLLNRWGCKVLLAQTSEQAVELMRRQPDIEILLVDYRLGEKINGVELIEKLHSLRDEAIPAALITADVQDELRQQCREKGVGFLGKPLKPAALRAWMNRQKVIS